MTNQKRDVVFISKATPADDQFALWLAPKLEAEGYNVFADILSRQGGSGLYGGDRWRSKLTDTLQNNAVKMLLCCTTETLKRPGVQEEIGIAEDLRRELNDSNFIIPLRLRPFKKVFGMGELQFLDFHDRWADGLLELLDQLRKFEVPRDESRAISPTWLEGRRYRGTEIIREPELLTSNWLRIYSAPDELNIVQPKNSVSEKTARKLSTDCTFPLIPFGRGFLTYASSRDLEEQFPDIGAFEIAEELDFSEFREWGCPKLNIEPRDAHNLLMNLFRQAWEKHCRKEGFLEYAYSNATAFHACEGKIDIGKRVPWGRQGQQRSSMLRNKSRGKLWEYGVSAIPGLFPYPHFKLKGRVLFSELDKDEKAIIIPDKKVQFRLRRSVCSVWRNKAWHGRVMAFVELLAGDSPYLALPVGAGQSILLDGMPVQVTSPATARQTNKQDEEAEETDLSTVAGPFDDCDDESGTEESSIAEDA